MKINVFKYIKMMFLLLLLFEGVVPHYHILNTCVGQCSLYKENYQDEKVSLSSSQHIVVHGISTMLKESDNIISAILALLFIIPVFSCLLVVHIKKEWIFIPDFRKSLNNYIIVVYLFFRPPPITA